MGGGGVNKKAAKLQALRFIWGFATYYSEGYGKNVLGDNLQGDVDDGKYTEKEAFKIQKEAYIESNKILNRITKLKTQQP